MSILRAVFGPGWREERQATAQSVQVVERGSGAQGVQVVERGTTTQDVEAAVGKAHVVCQQVISTRAAAKAEGDRRDRGLQADEAQRQRERGQEPERG